MSTVEAVSRRTRDRPPSDHERGVEVYVDLAALQRVGSPEGDALARRELERVGGVLTDRGAGARTTATILSALTRYAFLVADDCNPTHQALWRMHAIDKVPAPVLAGLTWREVRPRLGELAVTRAEETCYFPLTAATSHLLRLIRRKGHAPDSGPIFRRCDGQPWDVAGLTGLLGRLDGSQPALTEMPRLTGGRPR